MWKIEGTYTALVTPFAADESIDARALDALVEAQIQGGVAGLVPCGTTGESPSLSHAEQRDVVRRVVEVTAKRAQVIAGAGSNSTRDAVELARAAEKAGADAVMIVVPYYNKPTQDGLLRHFVTVAASVSCPVVVYNIPGRTGVDLAATTLERICEEAPNVVATKEATGNVLRAQEIARRLGDRVVVLSGDDALTLPMVSVGARGVISVTSNVLPRHVARATELALRGEGHGRKSAALEAHLKLLPVHEAMFIEANPGPAKAALALRGAMRDTVRGPLVPVSEATRRAITAALEPFSA